MASSEPPELAPRALQAREVINAGYNQRVHDLQEHMDKKFNEITNKILDITSKQAKQTDQMTKMRNDVWRFKQPHGDQERSISSIAESDEEGKSVKSDDDFDRKALVERMTTLEQKLHMLSISSDAGLEIHTEAIQKHSIDLRTETLSTMELLSKIISSAQSGIDAIQLHYKDLEYNLKEVTANTE